MIVLDGDRSYVDANPAACRLLGVGVEGLLGRRVDEFASDAARERLVAEWRTVLDAGGDRAGYELFRADRSRVTIAFTAIDELAPGRHLCLIRDATGRDAAVGPLRGSGGPLLDAQSVGGFGSWEWDLAADTVDWSDHAHHILGTELGARASLAGLLRLVHPDDRSGVAAALEAARTTRRRLSHEYRVLRPDGAFRVIESHGEVVVDADQRPSRVLGTVQDVTDRRQAEIERRNLATVLDTSDDAITTCSLDGVFLSWNRGAEKLYGYTAQEAIGQPLDLIIAPGERATDHLNWERLLNDEPVRSLETVRVTKDGRTVVVSVTRSLIIHATKGVIGVASVGRDVTQHKQAQALLAAAHAEAVAASEMKSQFLANMSHEIRTPMNGVIGMNELLLDTGLTEEQRFYAEQVARSGEDMMKIIDDILDVSKIEAGQLQLDPRDFAVHETVAQVCAATRVQAHAKGVILDLQVADDVPQRARGDDQRLRQVLLNLISNAVKFTSEGAVTVRAEATPQALGATLMRFEVADSGIGIDPATLDHMFEPFTQADPSMTRRYGGTGLGLAIARQLIDLMGGTIGAHSRPGHGSTFWFQLTLAAPTADHRQPTPAR